MVTTDTTHLNRECNAWREQLRSYRDAMGRLQNELQQFARHQNDKEVLSSVEHFYNQFYIQQINIHDLKQSIKVHERRVLLTNGPGDTSEAATAAKAHEQLHEQFETLEQTIRELVQDFSLFTAKA